METYRISNKRNGVMNGRRTAFDIHVRKGDAFLFAGQFYAYGFDRTDDECIAHYERTVARDLDCEDFSYDFI